MLIGFAGGKRTPKDAKKGRFMRLSGELKGRFRGGAMSGFGGGFRRSLVLVPSGLSAILIELIRTRSDRYHAGSTSEIVRDVRVDDIEG
jgi:hypothetical protein